MKQNGKIAAITIAAIGMICIGFVLGCLCTQHWVLGISYAKAIHTMYHDCLGGSYRY